MNYEQEYKKAFEAAKGLHDAGNALTKKQMEIVFPQLAESEDERIKKIITDSVFYQYGADKEYEDVLDYLDKLEKQKEQKPKFYPGDVIKCTSTGSLWVRCKGGDNIKSDGHTACIGGGFELASKEETMQFFHELTENGYQWDCIKGRPRKEEQKPVEWSEDFDKEVENIHKRYPEVSFAKLTRIAYHFSKWANRYKDTEWSEDWREEDIQTRFAFYTYKDDSSVLYLSNVFVEEASRNHGFGTRILRAAEKVAETIGAITICLKVKQDSPANAWYRKNGYGYVAFEDGYDWLEKNLEYLKPAKSTEWSEEDRLHYANVLEALEYVKGCKSDYDKIEAVKSDIAWLKLLRNRVGKDSLQPHWKPSEEQMEALLKAVDKARELHYTSIDGYDGYNELRSLYEQIKKLM